jgi:hypothetical protein
MIGVATVYSLTLQPLYCGGIYSLDNNPWIAVDVSQYINRSIHCGDTMLLTTPHGSLVAQALDAGYLHDYHVDQWQRLGYPATIIADIPAHLAPFPGLSCPATLVNLSALRRRTHSKFTKTGTRSITRCTFSNKPKDSQTTTCSLAEPRPPVLRPARTDDHAILP